MPAFLKKFLELFSRQENAYYKSQRLACARDLGLSDTASWREIIDVCDSIALIPASLLEKARAIPEEAWGHGLLEKDTLEASSIVAKQTQIEHLRVALRVEQRLMGLNL